MIWILCFALSLIIGFYIGWPLWRGADVTLPTNADSDKEINAYQQQLESLGPTDADQHAKHKLQRTLLSQTSIAAKMSESSTASENVTGAKRNMAAGLGIAICAASLLLYNALGTPNGSREAAPITASKIGPNANASSHEDLSMAELMARLERALKDDPSSIEGWRLYARSLLTLGRYDDAKTAFEKALTLSGHAPELLKEQQNILAYISRMTGAGLKGVPQTTPPTQSRPRPLTQAEMQSGQAMNTQDRSTMIMGMINGLATRLEDEPNDIAGWKKLLRARAVLGQTDSDQAKLLAQNIKTVQEQFKENQSIVDDIMTASTLK